MQKEDSRITLRAFLFGFLFAAIFAAVTVYFADRREVYLTATQLPVMPYVLLFLTVLLINPVCRAVRFIRVFSPAEILIVFIMGLVSSGISTFGMTAQLVPVVGSLFNRSWNNEQTEWNRHVTPFLNENYFIAEPGIRAAAADYRDRYAQRQHWQHIVDTAARYEIARTRLAASEREWQRERDAGDGSVASAMAVEREARSVQIARENLRQTQGLWTSLRAQVPELSDTQQTLNDYRLKLATAETELQAARLELVKLEQAAFDKVEIFRRGLPRDLRAYPGFVKLSEDTVGSYLSRFRRMLEGRHVVAETRTVLNLLADSAPLDDVTPVLQSLHQRLQRMADTTSLRADLDEKIEAADRFSGEVAALEAELRELHRRRREADRDEFRGLERRISRIQSRITTLTRQRTDTVKERDYLQQQLENLRSASELERMVAELAGASAAGRLPDDVAAKLRTLLEGLPAIDGSVRRFLVGDVPWRDWIGPLLRWGFVIGLTYLVLMTFNVLIFRQWAHNEKLIYPLAELPEFLAGHGSDVGVLPQLFRSGLFWVGFAISGSFLTYNMLIYAQLLPGLAPLDLRNPWTAYLPNTPLQGLLGVPMGGFARSEIFFTMIGLSFLIPKKVSFSLWFFALMSMVQVLILVAFGYGQNEASFPREWWYTLNFRTAQGGGALIIFSSFVLFKCRRYLLCAFAPSSVRDLPDDERRELRLSSMGFLLGSVGIVLTLWLNMGANLLYTIGSYFIIMVITVGLIRAVAEGGILGFQAWSNPFHFIRSFFGMDKAWTSATLFAPLMVYYSVIFLDIKTFVAPAMANSLKIRDDLKMQRGRFHLAIFAAIAVAAVVSVSISVMMAYSQGADVMSGWFYTNFPRDLFDKIATVSRTPPLASPGDTGWVIVGGAAMAALLYFRQTAFWLPHPIGLIMLVNPIMGAYWFSIMIGWLAKSMVTKYGNKDTYSRARTLFIGLIVGELIIVIVAMLLTVAVDLRIPIDLNRNI